MNLYTSELALQNHETKEMTGKEILMHYLVVMRRYIDYLEGKNNYARNRFQILWNDSLLQQIPPKTQRIIHKYFLDHVSKYIQGTPQLVIEFLTHPDLIPVMCRCQYYEHYYNQVSKLVPMAPDDPRPHYRDVAQGDFYSCLHARWELPEDLLKALEENSAEGTDIALTLMGKTWTAEIFGLALYMKASNIIRHFAQILTLDDEVFSAYDCIIHTLSDVRDYCSKCDFAISVLKIFEEERPGILRNYHDAYGNNLLKFLGEGESSTWELRKNIENMRMRYPELLSYLIEAGCNPDEKNTLCLSFNDLAN